MRPDAAWTEAGARAVHGGEEQMPFPAGECRDSAGDMRAQGREIRNAKKPGNAVHHWRHIAPRGRGMLWPWLTRRRRPERRGPLPARGVTFARVRL
jgi:hypothetical protein